MKAAPGARSWIAAGVRHELFTRALPALRHDMASPVSVIRMGLLLLKRQAASPTADEAAWEQRTAMIEEQVNAVVSGIRSLRNWELSVSDDVITRSALVAQCVGLMRTAFELNGIGLEVGESLSPENAPGDEVSRPEGAALRYMVLGALGYLNDRSDELGAIRVDAEGADALRFTGVGGTSEAPDPMARALRAPRTLAIDAVALQALSDGLGYAVSVDGNSVLLWLVPA